MIIIRIKAWILSFHSLGIHYCKFDRCSKYKLTHKFIIFICFLVYTTDRRLKKYIYIFSLFSQYIYYFCFMIVWFWHQIILPCFGCYKLDFFTFFIVFMKTELFINLKTFFSKSVFSCFISSVFISMYSFSQLLD